MTTEYVYWSDMHVDIHENAYIDVANLDYSTKTLILAGDIANNIEDISIFIRLCLTKFETVIFVPGNHDHYAVNDPEDLRLCVMASIPDEYVGKFHFLNGDYLWHRGTLIIGATLWTDYNNLGIEEIQRVPSYMSGDFLSTGTDLFTLYCRHLEHKAFIFNTLLANESALRPAIVVTHHAPCGESTSEHYRNAIYKAGNSAFFSELSSPILEVCARRSGIPMKWIHGHMHNSVKYMIGDYCEVMNNPGGYSSHENPEFDLNAGFTL